MKFRSVPRLANGRCVPVAETVARLEAALGKACPFSYSESRLTDCLFSGRVKAEMLDFNPMGKGYDSLSCKASTLAETVEWLALSRVRSLPGHAYGPENSIPDALPLASLVEHVGNMTPSLLERIRGSERAQHWVDGWSLVREAACKVPIEYVQALSGTNGMGAGNCLEEAVAQALGEIMERRSVITVMRQQMSPSVFEAGSLPAGPSRAIAGLRARGVNVEVLDMSFGGALPVVGCFFEDTHVPEGFQARQVFKAASAWRLEHALMGCLTEYAQLENIAACVGTDFHASLLAEDSSPAAANCLPLFLFGFLPWRDVSFLRAGNSTRFETQTVQADCLADIDAFLEIIRQLGKDCIAVDMTDPAIGFPVVQVVIPGYSDILPYHPPSSPVLLEGWTRDLAIGRSRVRGRIRVCTARRMFPGW